MDYKDFDFRKLDYNGILEKLKENRKLVLLTSVGVLAGSILLTFSSKLLKPSFRSLCMYVLTEDEEEQERDRTKSVEAHEVKLGTISRRLNTVGKLRANELVTLKSEANARVKEIHFKEGTEVKKDDLLIQFEDSDAQAELRQAEAEFAQKEADFGRSSKLRAQSFESSKKFDEAQAGFKMAQARVETAKARLEKMVIKAPFDGNIGLLDISAGAFVQAGYELVTLVDVTPIKVDFKIPEKNLHDVGVGQSAEIKLDGFPGQIMRAFVEAIDSKVDPLSHSISIRATLSNEDHQLKPGLFANVSLIIGEKTDSILIPESAVERMGDVEYVWMISKGKAARRRVLTGTRENAMIEIDAGLRPGELVITSGQVLRDGDPVKILNQEENQTVPVTPEQPVESQAGAAPKEASKSPEPTPSTEQKPEAEKDAQTPVGEVK
ncbi:MAG TPA: efflux RND transporter periplasmic adaptor subunit [Alphaproteobacteria bacterium]|nr:efflux RND transporter periplasmic adaptor subunit [Alphaproteobacteria bacterium]